MFSIPITWGGIERDCFCLSITQLVCVSPFFIFPAEGFASQQAFPCRIRASTASVTPTAQDFNQLPADLVVSLLQYGSLSAREADILTLVCLTYPKGPTPPPNFSMEA